MIRDLLRPIHLRLRHQFRSATGTPNTQRPCLEYFESRGTDREWQQIMMYSKVIEETVDVPGEIAEFGVASGASFKAFVRMNNILNKSRYHDISKKHVYGFDSFEGLPALDPHKDLARTGGIEHGEMRRGGFDSRDTLAALKDFCESHEGCSLIQGWYVDTLPSFIANNPHISFSLIHIDCDIYSSTKDVLTHALKRLNVGGVLLFDEIFHRQFPGETEAFWEVYNSVNNEVSLAFQRIESMPWKWYSKRVA